MIDEKLVTEIVDILLEWIRPPATNPSTIRRREFEAKGGYGDKKDRKVQKVAIPSVTDQESAPPIMRLMLKKAEAQAAIDIRKEKAKPPANLKQPEPKKPEPKGPDLFSLCVQGGLCSKR